MAGGVSGSHVPDEGGSTADENSQDKLLLAHSAAIAQLSSQVAAQQLVIAQITAQVAALQINKFTIGDTEPVAANTGIASVPNWTPQGPDITQRLIITVPGTIIEYRNIKAVIDIRAAGVIIRYCNITGPVGVSADRPLLYCLNPGASVLIQQCFIQPSVTSRMTDCIYGQNMHVVRNDISHGVDMIGIHSATGQTLINNVIEGNYLHDHALFTPDPSHPDNVSHNDGSQVFYGTGVTWLGNSIHGYGDLSVSSIVPLTKWPAPYYTNALFQINTQQGPGTTNDLHIVKNWLYGGASTVNCADLNNAVSIFEFSGNRIMELPKYGKNAIITSHTPSSVNLTGSGNVLADGTPITLGYGDGRNDH